MKKLPALYPIVNVAGDSRAAVDAARGLALELADAGAAILQVRAKSLGSGAFLGLVRELVRGLEGSDVRIVVNDRADVAAAAGAGGVHVGDEDLPVSAVRAVVGEACLVGWSTHSVEDVLAASGTGADYLGFGPVFESPTKAGVREARGLEALRAACRATHLPVVAIGGVTLERAPDCWRAGAASVAVIREIEDSRDRRSLLRAWKEAASAFFDGPSR